MFLSIRSRELSQTDFPGITLRITFFKHSTGLTGILRVTGFLRRKAQYSPNMDSRSLPLDNSSVANRNFKKIITKITLRVLC